MFYAQTKADPSVVVYIVAFISATTVIVLTQTGDFVTYLLSDLRVAPVGSAAPFANWPSSGT